MPDHYKILEIERGASAEEIKTAYRKMASKHHPDKGGDTAKFQEIQAAYAALTNGGGGNRNDEFYDFDGNMAGDYYSFFRGGRAGSTREFEEMLSSLYRQQAEERRNRNPDVKTNINVTLADTLTAQERVISIRTGGDERKTVDVSIPRGVAPGATIKYTGLGSTQNPDVKAGDLYIQIHIVVPPDCAVTNNRVDQLFTVDMFQAALGGAIKFKTAFDEELEVMVPVGIQSGQKLRLQGRGLALGKEERGDLYLQVKVQIPRDLNARAVELLREAQEASKSS